MELISQKLPILHQAQLKIANLWQSLSLPEKLYSSSLLILMIPFGGLQIAALFTFIGLILEFWPRFANAWESLAGKAFILLFYASITNFALAFSAAIVNEVTGVSASYFNYTHNFSLMLILPIWVVGISLGALLLFQLIMPFYLLLLIALKPFGIKLVRLFSKSEHPLLTNSVRFAASFAVLVQFINLVDGEEKIDKALATIDPNKAAQIESETKEPKAQKVTVGVNNKENADNMGVITLNTEDGHSSIVKSLIASFAYMLEADIHSRCQSPKGTRSIELNDYEVLHISKDENAVYGFTFTVEKCVSAAFPMGTN